MLLRRRRSRPLLLPLVELLLLLILLRLVAVLRLLLVPVLLLFRSIFRLWIALRLEAPWLRVRLHSHLIIHRLIIIRLAVIGLIVFCLAERTEPRRLLPYSRIHLRRLCRSRRPNQRLLIQVSARLRLPLFDRKI